MRCDAGPHRAECAPQGDAFGLHQSQDIRGVELPGARHQLRTQLQLHHDVRVQARQVEHRRGHERDLLRGRIRVAWRCSALLCGSQCRDCASNDVHLAEADDAAVGSDRALRPARSSAREQDYGRVVLVDLDVRQIRVRGVGEQGVAPGLEFEDRYVEIRALQSLEPSAIAH